MVKCRILLILVFVFLIISSVSAFPGFMIIEGNVKIDNRDADIGTTIKFYIENEEVANSTISETGEYLVLINKDISYTGKLINITIEDYEAEQKINYNSPDYATLNLSTTTDKALKITNYYPLTNQIINENENQEFNITYSTGYGDPVSISWFLNDELVSNTNSYIFVSNYNSSGDYTIKVIITDGYLILNHSWELNVDNNLECEDGQQKACQLQQGVCFNSFETCTNGHWLGCNYGSDYETSETKCDNKDNNCDGTIDESLTRIYGTNVGECSTGIETCNAGSWITTIPAIEPITEICDNKDNNCDGGVDDNIANIYDGTDTGECQKEIKSCIAGSWQITQNKISPITEICDNKDNNCDDSIDESLTKQFGTDVGVCEYGTLTCNIGIWGETTNDIEPITEICNERDDDCDGSIDEECIITCIPSAEICNGKDDDCDGSIDEYLISTQSCTVGIGACARNGTQIIACLNSVSGPWGGCSAVSGSPNTEICNNIDDDCDGLVDEEDVCLSIIYMCNDKIDNDNDGFIDLYDVDCSSSTDNSESGTQQECKPGIISLCGINGTKTCQSTGFYGICENEKQPEIRIEQNVTIPVIEQNVTTIDEAEKTLTKIETNNQQTGMELSLSTNNQQTGNIEIKVYDNVPQEASFTARGLANQKYIVITPDQNIESDVKQALIKIYYNHADLGDIQEENLRIYYYDENKKEWVVEPNSGADTIQNYVWAITDHLSLFTLGESTQAKLTKYYYDKDQDGYGRSNDYKELEHATGSYSALQGGDCYDAEVLIYPGAKEFFNNRDDNCNGQVDEGFPSNPASQRFTNPRINGLLVDLHVAYDSEHKKVPYFDYSGLLAANLYCQYEHNSVAKAFQTEERGTSEGTYMFYKPVENGEKGFKNKDGAFYFKWIGCMTEQSTPTILPTITENPKPLVLHRTVKSCKTKIELSPEITIKLDTYYTNNTYYTNYECISRYNEQCLQDKTFDTYYDEWCEY